MGTDTQSVKLRKTDIVVVFSGLFIAASVAFPWFQNPLLTVGVFDIASIAGERGESWQLLGKLVVVCGFVIAATGIPTKYRDVLTIFTIIRFIAVAVLTWQLTGTVRVLTDSAFNPTFVYGLLWLAVVSSFATIAVHTLELQGAGSTPSTA